MSNEIVAVEEKKGLDIFGNIEDFKSAYRMAEALASTDMVPTTYQKKPANCLIAMEMGVRLGISALMVMQNLDVVHGRPTWRGSFVAGLINGSRRFKGPLRYELSGSGEKMQCYAYAVDLEGNIIKGTTITMEMAKKEGWSTKNGSKWLTMPEQMIQYRAASYFGRVHCPDVLLGLYTAEEVEDFTEGENAPIMDVETEIKEQANKVEIDISPAPEKQPEKSKAEPKVEPTTKPAEPVQNEFEFVDDGEKPF